MLEQGQYQPDDELDNFNASQQDESQPIVKTEKKLIINQRVAIAVLCCLGLFTFVFWASQLRKSLQGPFANYNSTGSIDDLASSSSDQVDLKKDTDTDGLTDYEEQNIYKTSAYSADSDSDGIKDGDEVAQGKDPNCPEGRNCFGNATSSDIISPDGQNADSSGVSTTSVIKNLNISDTNSSSSSQSSSSLENLMSGNVSAAELRQLLVQQGMDKKMLDGISDELLMSTFKDSLKSNK